MIRHNLQGIGKKETEAVLDTIDNQWITAGNKYTSLVEQKIGEICNVNHPPHCIATNTGSAALHTVFEHIPHSEARDLVLVPAIGWYSTAEAALLAGFDVEFLDVDPDSGMICDAGGCIADMETLQKYWDRIAAVCVVHLHGNYGVVEPSLLPEEAFLVEDAAGALGTLYPSQDCWLSAGNTSGFGIFSFNGNKICTAGAGGMIVTQFADKADEMRAFINHNKGQNKIGANYRLPEINAAVLHAQLSKLLQYISERRATAREYIEQFSARELPLELWNQSYSNHWCITFRAKHTLDMMQYLLQNGVECRVPLNVADEQHKLTLSRRKLFPGAVEFTRNHISLPSGTNLTFSDIHRIAQVVERYFNEHSA